MINLHNLPCVLLQNPRNNQKIKEQNNLFRNSYTLEPNNIQQRVINNQEIRSHGRN